MNFVQRCGIPEGLYYKSYSKQASSINPNILILLNSLLMFHDKRNVSSAMTRVPDYTTLSSFHTSCPTSSTFCSSKRMLVLQTKWRKTVQLSFLRLPPCFACIPLFTIQFSSVAQSFLSLRNPLNHRPLGLKLMSIESVMPSNHLILCSPLLLPPSIFPSIRVFSKSHFFASDGQSVSASCKAWFPYL